MYRKYYKHNFDYVELQEQRRKELLQKQKKRRIEVQDEYREVESFLRVPPSKYEKRREDKKHRRMFHGIYRSDLCLQLSEWLREHPDDLDDYVLVPCPRGLRCLVVARGEHTKIYNKMGKCINTFSSMLPGDGLARRTLTMLDCIYEHSTRTIYVLDALVYANTDLIDCDAQFRFFWLRSKIEEEESLGEFGEDNHKIIRALERYDMADKESVQAAFQRFPLWPDNYPELDGFLFYHKEASYTCGTTPLVCWLFPFMVKDVLGMDVSSEYIKPPDYVEPVQYMKKFDGVLLLKQRSKYAMQKPVNDNDPAGSGLNADAMDDVEIEKSSVDALTEVDREMEMEDSEEDDENEGPACSSTNTN